MRNLEVKNWVYAPIIILKTAFGALAAKGPLEKCPNNRYKSLGPVLFLPPSVEVWI